MDRCFACGKPLGNDPPIAITEDGQIVDVGQECLKKTTSDGYQPPRGGPRLFPPTQSEFPL
jgi:hypothetical protein